MTNMRQNTLDLGMSDTHLGRGKAPTWQGSLVEGSRTCSWDQSDMQLGRNLIGPDESTWIALTRVGILTDDSSIWDLTEGPRPSESKRS
jgi:hypothetical protein|uniref:Uncharacterized protein n=1 Tax=Picea glauca TaxID=3330 RepID=A0A117NJA9_PICGL|nr:hypothetical protein ABT39_MTgene1135 [Picea glauca]QHR90612.1 hypothetical protein Q903MT_gene4637 [Picea sitchensis]